MGERWQELCKTFGANLVVVSTPYGKTPTPDMLAAALKEHPDTSAVYATLSDTSTGIGSRSDGSRSSSQPKPSCTMVRARV